MRGRQIACSRRSAEETPACQERPGGVRKGARRAKSPTKTRRPPSGNTRHFSGSSRHCSSSPSGENGVELGARRPGTERNNPELRRSAFDESNHTQGLPAMDQPVSACSPRIKAKVRCQAANSPKPIPPPRFLASTQALVGMLTPTPSGQMTAWSLGRKPRSTTSTPPSVRVPDMLSRWIGCYIGLDGWLHGRDLLPRPQATSTLPPS
jgi:hypothetical protein